MRQMHVIFLENDEAAGLAILMDDGFRFYAANEVFRDLEVSPYETVAEISQRASLTVQQRIVPSLSL